MQSPIRVMFVTPCFGFGGLERVILGLLSNIDRTRFLPSFCTLYTPDPEMYGKLAGLDLSYTTINKGEGVNVSLPVRLARLLKRERIDLVNSHDIGATLFAAPAARLAGITRVVHTDHSQILTKKRYLAVYRFIMRHFVTHSVTVSQALKEYLVRAMRIGPETITTIPNGADISPFLIDHDGTGLRRELCISDGDRIIGTVGRLMEQKGTEHLIRAFSLLLRNHPSTMLVIVGEGELRTHLEHLAAELGIGARIRFTGIRQDIPELMSLFDIFILPSLWEGQPITIIEAMAASKPVIATDVGGNTELLREGELGLLVPPRDPLALAEAMTRLFDDQMLSGRLGQQARKIAVRELSSVSMTRRYEDLFGALFQKRNSDNKAR